MAEVGVSALQFRISDVILRESLQSALERLTAAHVGSPRLNAETLLMFTLGCDRAYLYAHPNPPPSSTEKNPYTPPTDNRSRGVPAQYISGHQEFWGMDLIVSPAVLIPRPETEHVIETVLSVISKNAGSRIVDVGTGSGAIALALAKELLNAEIHATDISSEALEIARANAARHRLQDRVRFHQADLLGELTGFDIVVSNPPYVGESEEDHVQLEVRKFEPRQAVFAGPTGLEVISRLVPQARSVVNENGWLVMEISGTIVEGVRRLLKDWQNLRITPDLQGIPRVAAAQKLITK